MAGAQITLTRSLSVPSGGTYRRPRRSIAVTASARKGDGMTAPQDHESDRMSHVLGAAVIAAWSDLPRDIQEKLFAKAVVLGHVSESDQGLREQLAQFLHQRHRRTSPKLPA